MSSPSSTPLLSRRTSIAFPTSSASSPDSSSTSTQGSNDATANATLYLYTFLATLVLLLAVSSAIVIRSLVLRRRHRRIVDEAIRTGTWPPQRFESTTGRRRRDIGQKPKLLEAWLHANDDEDDEKRKWVGIMPVYAAYVNQPTLSPQGPVTGSTENSVDLSSRPSRFIRPFTRRRSPPPPPPLPTTASPMASQALFLPTSSPTAAPTPAVRVAVLIAMPGSSQEHSGDENGPPVVEIGIVEVEVKDDETETPNPDGS